MIFKEYFQVSLRFTASKTTVKVTQEIEFDASASYDPDFPEEGGYIVSYYWDFGDGTAEYSIDRWGNPEPYIKHSYEMAGNYTVTLVVTDDMGAQGEAEITVEVR